MSDSQRTCEQLWQEYLFLTQEMLKFITREDLDLYMEIFNQRTKLQGLIEQSDDTNFYSSAKGREYFKTIQQAEKAIKIKLEFIRNTTSRQNKVANAYDGYSISLAGRRMDRQT